MTLERVTLASEQQKLHKEVMGSDIKHIVKMKPVNLDQKLVKNRQCRTERLFRAKQLKYAKTSGSSAKSKQGTYQENFRKNSKIGGYSLTK